MSTPDPRAPRSPRKPRKPRKPRIPRSLIVLGLLCLALPLASAGCGHDRIETPRAEALAQLRYPEEAQRGPVLDVLVHTRGREVHLINRTPRNYRGMQLWLNRQYVREVDEVRIGEGNYYDLRSFINHWQEPFPTARLLAPERRRPLVLAELYDPEADVRYPLQTQPE